MSNEGDRASVLRTTKVRTKLRGDGSWLLRQEEPEAETQEEEKPWLAEVRARRLNGAPIETSPISSPVQSTPPPVQSEPESKPVTQGYLIRGVFTKLDMPVSSPSDNGTSKPKTFIKKPSQSYLKIAPHIVRNTSENPEGELSPEEMERRKEAAIGVLKTKAAKQRSYVLSAAKLYEAKDTPSDASLASSSPSFVATRVETVDDDESTETPAAADAAAPSPVVPPASTASAPTPTPRTAVNTTEKITDKSAVNEPVTPKATEATAEAAKEDPLPQSVPEKQQLQDTKTSSNYVKVTASVDAVSTEPQPRAVTPLVKLLPAQETSTAQKSVSSEAPALTSTVAEPPVPVTRPAPAAAAPAPVMPVPALSVKKLTVKTETEPEAEHKPEPEVKRETEAKPEPKSIPKLQLECKPSAEPSSSIDTLAVLSDTLISLNTNPSSAENDKQELAEEEGGSADSLAPEDSVKQEPAPVLRDGGQVTGHLLNFSDDGPEEPEDAVPPSPGRWSQDLLSGLGSESSPAKTSDTLDLLVNDVISVNTETRSFSTLQREEEKQTDKTAVETQSQEENATPWSSHVTTTVTKSSSADPFDPYPIGTASHNSPSDLLEPIADASINSSATKVEEEEPSSESVSPDYSSIPRVEEQLLVSGLPDEEKIFPMPVPQKIEQLEIIECKKDDEEVNVEHEEEVEDEDEEVEEEESTPHMELEEPMTLNLKPTTEEISIKPSSVEVVKMTELVPVEVGEKDEEEEVEDGEEVEEEEESSPHPWITTWEIPQQANTEESQEAETEDKAGNQQTVIMFERKSTENDSPWDRWTSPTVYTISPATGDKEEEEEEEEKEEEEEEEEEERSATYTTTVVVEERQVPTPEPDSKKPFVYVKEYVNASETSLLNPRDTLNDTLDVFSSSSSSYSYSSPSSCTRVSLSSTCTYCGKQVGNEAKITIEHLNINCHPECFKCDVCSRPMGDLLDSMFLHNKRVHCESCYTAVI